MAKIKKLLVAITGAMMTFPMMAGEPSITPPGTGDSGDLTLRKKYTPPPPPPKDPLRPKMPPIAEYLHGSYSDGVLTVEFPSDAEMGTVTIGTGDFTVFAASIDSANPSVQLPPLSGSFILSIAFDNGDEYEGEIEI